VVLVLIPEGLHTRLATDRHRPAGGYPR